MIVTEMGIDTRTGHGYGLVKNPEGFILDDA